MTSLHLDPIATTPKLDNGRNSSTEDKAQPSGAESGETIDSSTPCELQDQSQRLPFALRGYSPLESATLIVSFLIAQGLAGAASGPVMARYARYMPVLRCGLAVWTLGVGLKLLFGQNTHISIYVIVLAIEGAGVGWVHQPGLVALQANSTDEDRAVATGTRNVFRSLGGVVGVAVSTATYYAVLSKALGEAVPDWVRDVVLDGTWRIGDPGTSEYESDILNARMEGFRAVFIMSIPLMALCLIASLLVADIVLKGDNDNVSEDARSRDSEQEVGAS
ncbi:hypothetical protein FPSE5266_05294 [Fusarium pseudograminearum]|nr:hypothetical protein FPSE5266_05294 [Fusarium pseudograminearum]